MTVLHSYLDDRLRCFANVRMDNGDPVFISVARTSVLVKKSKAGLFGPKLFRAKSRHKVLMTASALDSIFPDRLTPAVITDPVLSSFTNAALHCSTTVELANVLNTAVARVGE